MASKKNNRDKLIDIVPQKSHLGKLFYYVGAAKGVKTTCPSCGRSKSRGRVYEFEKMFFCNDKCIAMKGNA